MTNTDTIPTVGTITLTPNWANVRRFVLAVFRTDPARAVAISREMACEAPIPLRNDPEEMTA